MQTTSINPHLNVMKEIIQRSDCPISFSLDFIGDKWVLLILRDLIFTNKKSYGDFLTSAEKIATNILADRLKLLESNGFIQSVASPGKKNKFLYSLTKKGIDLIPAIVELTLWGAKYSPFDKSEMVQKLKKNKAETIKQIMDQLEKDTKI